MPEALDPNRIAEILTDHPYAPRRPLQVGYEENELAPTDLAAIITGMVPVLGDVLGLGADADMYMRDPESREFFNYVLSAAGLLPFVPSASQVKQGIKAYHGSPHDFDKFSTEQIGTGEGVQAYGHGLYFADSEDVATGYRDQLTSHMLKDVQSPHAAAAESFKDAGYSVDDARSGLQSAYPSLSPEDIDSVLRTKYGGMYQVDIDVSPDELLDWDKPLSEQSERVQDFIKANKKPRPTWGDYRVTEADKNNFDGDRYPSINPGQWIVKADDGSWGGVGLTTRKEAQELALIRNEIPEATDQKGYVFLEQHIGKGKKGADKMKDAGIKGIRYKDGFSRGDWNVSSPETTVSGKWMVKNTDKPLSKGEFFDSESEALKALEVKKKGTSNYVIFDDRLISISKKYGIAIPVAAALLAKQTGEDPDKMYQEDSSA